MRTPFFPTSVTYIVPREKLSTESLRQDLRFKEQDDASCALMKALLETRNVQSEELQAHFETLTQSQRREYSDTRAAFVRLDGEKRRHLVERDILFSLKFPQIHDRYDQIARAHENTFTWIFQDPQAYHKPWDNFIQWILDGSGIYWIQGKAASGKSTLMRYIWNHGLTTQALRTWSAGSQLTISSFFFWNSGIPEQRTQTGLLRSLLYETLNDHKDLVPDVFPEEWQTKSDSAARDQMIIPEVCSLPRLQKAFRRLIGLIGLSSQHLKLCFFIDGLDEYEGEPEDIAQYFKNISLCSVHTKFCISSRPWPVFQDIYHNTPGLKLQDLTYDDIKLYVNDKLEKTDHMQRLSVIESQNSSLLVEELVQKAAGVFLWVTLVVKSLLNGLRNGDEISHLRRRLESIPSGLEELYEHMLKSIEPLYREEASQIFQIFRATGHELDVPTLTRALWFSDYRQAIDLKAFATQLDSREVDRIKLERMVMKLNSRCKGLLEAVQPYCHRLVKVSAIESPREPVSVPRVSEALHVSYLHGSLRDYLELPHVWAQLLSLTEHTDFDPNTALLTSYVLELKTTSFVTKGSYLYSAGNGMLRRVEALSLSASTRHMELFEELDKSINRYWYWTDEVLNGGRLLWSSGNPKYTHTSSEFHERLSGDALAMAVKFRLKWYLDAKAASTGSLQREDLSRLPLLVYALGFDEWVVRKAVPPPDCTMVEKLLIHGADPNQLCEKFTVWQYVIRHLAAADVIKCEDIAKWSELCALMLQHGADPYACSPEGSISCEPILMLESASFFFEGLLMGDDHTHRVTSSRFSGQEVCIQDSPHDLCNSATSMIRDTFGGHDSYKQLAKLLQEKKVTTPYTRKKKKSRKRGKEESQKT